MFFVSSTVLQAPNEAVEKAVDEIDIEVAY